MDERYRFVSEYRDGADSMSELCERYGISRETGYKWVRRFEESGAAGLTDRSRRPHHSPRTTAPEVIEALIAARRKHPTWGPKKLLGRTWPLAITPALSTASAILKRHGLVARRRRRRWPGHPGRPRGTPQEPNAIWTIDFKGQFRTGDGTWCYPLTIVDGFSRYLLACQRLPNVRTAGARATLERVFREYGLPRCIRSDNGAPFASTWTLARLSALRVWWIQLGIVSELIEPGRPEQNGRHERLHRTLKQETTRPAAATARAQQARFNRFRREYNEERPHEALGQRPPAEFYTGSSRRYPSGLPPLEYPPAFVTRRVGPSGCLTWHGRKLPVSHTLVGQNVGLDEVDDGRWRVYFGSLLLGYFDEHRWRMERIERQDL
jgi:transposase InsO family protein